MRKPILCLDWDGVIHSYVSGWKGAHVCDDDPVPGAIQFLQDALQHFRVAIFSSRSNQEGGIAAMQIALTEWAAIYAKDQAWLAEIEWPTEKPPAFLTIDDRALTFDGTWPSIESLKAFQPWNKRT